MKKRKLKGTGFRILVVASILVWVFVIIVSLFILQIRGGLRPQAADDLNLRVSAAGKIINVDDIGIAGAKIVFSSGQNNNYVYTDSGGRFNAIGLVAGDYTVKVEAEGYKLYESTLTLKAYGSYSITVHRK